MTPFRPYGALSADATIPDTGNCGYSDLRNTQAAEGMQAGPEETVPCTDQSGQSWFVHLAWSLWPVMTR
ncbi:hypothetical protein [Streptomyces arboris]|uniref:Uncharacterized protein n=1 Tax=Streptomyces arboris TaxID=2600619 RepID=A0A5N5EEC1_9ACTN|nr:hypothetical protein [Streptomyces arboris]KAB2588393.1 hypothetical protein F5983_32635 [Streptomyces arboris]